MYQTISSIFCRLKQRKMRREDMLNESVKRPTVRRICSHGGPIFKDKSQILQKAEKGKKMLKTRENI